MVMTIMNYEIQALSRPSCIKFQNFQGPIQFSRTFQVLEKNGYCFSRTFKEVWPHCNNLSIQLITSLESTACWHSQHCHVFDF